MTDFKKIFLDTSPIVYYLENNELYYSKMKRFLNEYGDCDYITSAVTVTEYLTYPFQQNNLKLINTFYAFVDGMDIEIKNIDKDIAEKAAYYNNSGKEAEREIERRRAMKRKVVVNV